MTRNMLRSSQPWYLKIRNLDQDTPPKEFKFDNANTYFPVTAVGTYQILEVRDIGCPGMVGPPNDKFTITMIERPKVRLPPSSAITQKDNIFVRKAVCEGDEDAVELAFVGQPPFTVDYERIYHPEGAPKRHVETNEDRLVAGLSTATVRLETSKAGVHEYKFKRLADGLYDDPREKNMPSPITLQQTVYPRPSITFLNPKKVYKYCLDSAAGEDSIIPIQLTGVC
jgi:nucleoporin POM152